MVPRVSSNSSALRGELFGLYGGRLTRSIKSFGVDVDVESGEPVNKTKGEFLYKSRFKLCGSSEFQDMYLISKNYLSRIYLLVNIYILTLLLTIPIHEIK